MKHYRLTINRVNKKATVERRSDLPWKEWDFLGVVASEQAAEELIRNGWPNWEGRPTQDLSEPFTLEVVR